MTKTPKVKPYTEQWELEASELARRYVPSIYPCKKCGHPVVYGYVCTFCGDTNPDEEEDIDLMAEIVDDPTSCPFCHNSSIDKSNEVVLDDTICFYMICRNADCRAHWREVYKLIEAMKGWE